MIDPVDDSGGLDEIAGADMESGTPLVARLFAKLANGEFHSGEALAADLGVSRSAVWKAAGTLKDLGATVHAVRNRGYRLPGTADPLDAPRITELLSDAARPHVARVDTAWTLGSTNTVLMERPYPRVGTGEALLAEYQTAGRGRRGRTWVAPPGGAICLSFSWVFAEVPRDLGALGLVVGVCALEALKSLGVVGVGLKWPNDLLIEDRKLGGILIELRAESSGPACVVIGIGLNIALGAPLLAQIAATGLAPIDLVSAGLKGAQRNAVAAALISSFATGLLEFERAGLKSFLQRWMDADVLRGRPVTVTGTDGFTKGIARGIDLEGALLVETPQSLLRFISGDVSVRADT
jgi:BirA family transcriptional regulator, biotin operon repressor / biotin---[acetyl-CoA-carboxylase] ligase